VDEKAAIRSAREHIAELLSDRVRLLEQIKQSQETIARSKDLLKRIDEMLGKHGVKP
jgi:hypothetical protein